MCRCFCLRPKHIQEELIKSKIETETKQTRTKSKDKNKEEENKSKEIRSRNKNKNRNEKQRQKQTTLIFVSLFFWNSQKGESKVHVIILENCDREQNSH